MKKIFMLSLALIAAVSCDLSDIRSQLNDHESRLARVELLCSQMNTNISSLNSLINAMQKGDYITGVKTFQLEGKDAGYVISFAKGQDITIYHGKNGMDSNQIPEIGVKKHTDDVYYWTVNGEWLLDEAGNKVIAQGQNGQPGADGRPGQDGQPGQDGKPGENGADGQNGQDGENGKDGLTPELKIEDGFWWVRYGQESWIQLGQATGNDGKPGQDGDSLFKSIEIGDLEVTFVLQNGESFVMPFQQLERLSIIFDDENIGIVAGGTATVGYTVQGTATPVVKTIAQNGWIAKVEQISATEGQIHVKAPDPLVEDDIIVLVSVGGDKTIMRTVNFVTGVITPAVETINLTSDPQRFETSFDSNLQCEIIIPEEAKSWLAVVPSTKSVSTESLSFDVTENDGIQRSAKVQIKDQNSTFFKEFCVLQEGLKKVITVKGIDFIMVTVKGGTFMMGDTKEQPDSASSPAHQVTLSDYYIAETEVTQELWKTVMGNNPSNFTGDVQRPVEDISWVDVVSHFLPKLNEITGKQFTLPTEAQWEFAARGGIKSNGTKYSGGDNIEDIAWYFDNSAKTTHPVKQKLSNELGLYDMTGNVFEYCSDWYGIYSPESQTDPRGPVSGSTIVARGGSYNTPLGDLEIHNRVYDQYPDKKYIDFGFRLAHSF